MRQESVIVKMLTSTIYQKKVSIANDTPTTDAQRGKSLHYKINVIEISFDFKSTYCTENSTLSALY